MFPEVTEHTRNLGRKLANLMTGTMPKMCRDGKIDISVRLNSKMFRKGHRAIRAF